MKHSRWRIFAVALLSVVVSCCLSGLGVFCGVQMMLSPRDVADQTEEEVIPTFDDLYKYTPRSGSGQTVLGSSDDTPAILALRDEYFKRDTLVNFLNSSVKRSFSEMDKNRGRSSYPVFSNSDLEDILNGVAVNNDGFIFEDVNEDGVFDYDDFNHNGKFDPGEDIDTETKKYDKFISECVKTPVVMLDTANADNVVVFELLNLLTPPTIRKMQYNGNTIETLRMTLADDQDASHVYGGIPVNVGTDQYPLYHYEISTNEHPVALMQTETGNCLRGIFQREGFYEFDMEVTIQGENGMQQKKDLRFSFYIVDKANYRNFPRFPLTNRESGTGEIYNYSYSDNYPTVTFNSSFFDVKINSIEQPGIGVTDDGDSQYNFYNIGEYRMVSTLIFRHFQSHSTVTLDCYSPYSSVLNILGFQAFYGGWHTTNNQPDQYNGPLPFYDDKDNSVNADISPWIEEYKLGLNRDKPDALSTQAYARDLAMVLDSIPEKVPVKTNFAPVKINGNVDYATGAGGDGDIIVLSTMSYQGMDDKTWRDPEPLEIGRPFSDAGRYLVVIYFYVNNRLCQQTFYFEIVNALDIRFTVNNGNTLRELTYDDLVRDKTVQGKDITVTYNGYKTLGKFEVPPTLRLERGTLDGNGFTDVTNTILKQANDGSFNFRLAEGRYRLLVTYGAYGQSVTIIELVVDNTKAQNVQAKSRANLQNAWLDALPMNTAIVGNDDVTLTWDAKSSGVKYQKVTVKHYKLYLEKVTGDPNEDRNYDNFNVFMNMEAGQRNLLSAYVFDYESCKSNDFTPVQDPETLQWSLKNHFLEAGLYEISIYDTVGNQTDFVLIIDTSRPTLVQNKYKSEKAFANVVDFGTENIKIGFGHYKIVKSLNNSLFRPVGNNSFSLVYNALHDSDHLASVNIGNNSYRESLIVPLAKVEISIDGGSYYEVSQTDYENGYVILNAEGTYYFRVCDVLGNCSEYYVILSNDCSKGLVYADGEARAFEKENNIVNDRGFIAEDLDANTSVVTATGGMTNRRNVLFSFEQDNEGEQYQVTRITLKFYPLTYNLAAKNYPFADDVDYSKIKHLGNDGVLYSYKSKDIPNTPFKIALYNDGDASPAGLYILTRHYYGYQNNSSDPSLQPKDYWFIVDRTGMLHYDVDKYQTRLSVRFGSDDKTARAADFERKAYTIESNRVADMLGFESKYSWHYDNGTQYLGYNFPALTPRFSVINNGVTTILGEGTLRARIGDQPTNDINYQLVVADNARSFSAVINNGSITELKSDEQITSANYGVLNLILNTLHGAQANIYINNNTKAAVQLEYDGNAYTYVMDPRGLTGLQFQFTSDPQGYYADVDIPKTSLSWTATGFGREIYFAAPEANGTSYMYDLFNNFLGGNGIPDGSCLSVTMYTKDNTATTYNILFDLATDSPTYNLALIQAQDNLICNYHYTEVPDHYVYGLNNDFMFQRTTTGNPYLDTKEISYREVTNYLEGSSLAKNIFRLDSGKTFAQVVGLRDNEMKYFQITETDYVGHVKEYFVQMQGANYNANINFIGAVSEALDGVTLGVEMQVSASSMHQFFLNNKYFRFESASGEEYYQVFNEMATWHFNDSVTNGRGYGIASEDQVIQMLNTWINLATTKGEKCAYYLYDRIGDIEYFEFYNIRANAPVMKLETYNLIPNSPAASPVVLQITNYDLLPKLLKEPKFQNAFQMEVIDVATGKTIPEMEFIDVATTDATTFYNIKKGQELIIKVTDPFGRTSITEYHGQDEVGLDFTLYGNTVDEVINAGKATEYYITYAGDKRGVRLKFLRSVYFINVYDASTGEVTEDYERYVDASGEWVTYSFYPSSNYMGLKSYHIQAVGKSSNAVLFERYFSFDTRMPVVEWTNPSEEPINVQNNAFIGSINLHLRENTATKFPVTISYVRTFEGRVSYVTLKPNTQNCTFVDQGKYVVTIRNKIWASQEFTFEIVSAGNFLLAVFDDGREMAPSTSMYVYKDKLINTYMFTMESYVDEYEVDQVYSLTNYEAHGLSIVPSQNSNRVIIGNTAKNTDYYDYDANNNTLIWRLAVPAEVPGDEPTSAIFFATTGVTRHDLNATDNISLIIDGKNRVDVKYETYMVRTNASEYENDEITVQLTPTANKIDSNGIPCFDYVGNTLHVDVRRNGELMDVLSFTGTENKIFHIGKMDAGIYEFKIHDLVGNLLYFGDGKNRTDTYTIVNLTSPLVLLNGANPVNGMIYNDSVTLDIVNYADDILKTVYGEEAFTNNFKIAAMDVTCNGQPVEMKNLRPETTTWTWRERGKYRVRLKYQIGEQILDSLDGIYEFQIVPSYLVLENYSLDIYPDIKVVSVRRNNYPLRDFNDLVAGDTMIFDAASYTGTYVITLETNSAMCGSRQHQITFNIGYKNSTTTSNFWLNTTSGGSTTETVVLSYQPVMLYYARGDVTIYIYKDGKLVDDPIVINSYRISDVGYDELRTFEATETGLYYMVAYDAEGDIVYADSWTIEAGQNTMGMIITGVVCAVGVVGLIIFIRMRRKMSVR